MVKRCDRNKYMKKYFEIFDSNDKDFDKVIGAHEFCCDVEVMKKSVKCGCFECYCVFDAKKLLESCEQGELVLCPNCDFDTIIGDASGYPVTDKQFLKKMQVFWMSPS
jgi:hypothetical protein